MAGSIQNGSGGRRPGHRFHPMSEINVTPFVDVMLVLLVIFMITAPLLTVGVPVDLPKAQTDTLQGNQEPITVTVQSDGKVYIQETEIALDELGPRLRAISDNDENARVFVRGDKAVDYGKVMEVMGTINAAGYRKVALVAEMPKSQR